MGTLTLLVHFGLLAICVCPGSAQQLGALVDPQDTNADTVSFEPVSIVPTAPLLVPAAGVATAVPADVTPGAEPVPVVAGTSGVATAPEPVASQQAAADPTTASGVADPSVTPADNVVVADGTPIDPGAAPVLGRRGGAGGGGTSDGTATAAAVEPAAFTSVTCKLDASGNVSDVLFTRAGSSTPGCTAAGVLAGGRNVVLDFSDSLVVQVQQGRLSAAGPVAWLAFKTDSSDMRTCGANVQPSRLNTVVTSWTAVGRFALNSATLTCDAGSSTMSAIASAGFTAGLPAVVSLGYGLPVGCTPVFSKPAPDINPVDNTACKTWLLGNTPTFPTSPVCPYTAKPNQWVQPITTQQLPSTRPPNWVYRTTATSSSVTLKNVFLSSAKYIQATVQHTPLVNVTPAMVNWWFNGNIDGDMQHPVNGQWYPRYLVWHPRDHVSQNTLIAGPTPGSAKGAWWSIVEFMMAQASSGYTKASAAGSWDKNYIAYNSIKVNDLTATSLDQRVVVDGQNPFKLTHTWASGTPTAQGWPQLTMTSTMQIGVPSTLLGLELTMNPVAWKLFGGDCCSPSSKDAANKWVQHCIEEMGNLQYFLPQLYKQQTGLSA